MSKDKKGNASPSPSPASTPTRGGSRGGNKPSANEVGGVASSLTLFGRSREEIQFATTAAVILAAVFFSYLCGSVVSSLQGPKVHSKMSRQEVEKLLSRWEPFSMSVFLDGQLGASLFALALACWLGSGWRRDKGKVLAATAVFLAVHGVLSMTLWIPVSLGAAAVSAYLFLVYVPPRGSRLEKDHVENVHSITPRTLFIIDASLIIYSQLLRFQTVDIPVGTDSLPASVDPVMHRAAHAALTALFLLVVIGSDILAYRSLLKVGAWIWFAASCSLLGVYEGGSAKWVVATISISLFVAHVAVHCMFPFNRPIVQFFRRWQSDMRKVVAGAGDE